VSAALLVFAATGALLIAAGAALARAGEQISRATGVGRVWIGAVLIAAATSLPELATDVSAVRLGAPDLAAGDLFGSSMANMLILAAVDLAFRRRQLLRQAALDNALLASLAIVLNALGAIFVLARPRHHLLGVAPESLLLVAVYLAGVRAVYRHGRRLAPGSEKPARADRQRLRGASLRFGVAALVTFGAAPPFAASAQAVAELSGLGSTFVGAFLVGLATSLPELVAAVAAVRLGAFDLAVGNLFGSNAFNMAIFLAMDLAAPEPIFAALDPDHALVAASAVLLMALGVAAMVYRAERRFGLLEPDSLLMVAFYAASAWMLYARSGAAG
jgi:cation:H+ antiporter